jgi:PAS domain S-box-containing protein
MATDERVSPTQISTDLDEHAFVGRFAQHPTIITLRRIWQQLTWVNALDPLRRLLNQGFATIVIVMIGFSTLLAVTLFLVNDPALPIFLFTTPIYIFVWWVNRRGKEYGILMVVGWSILAIVFGTIPSTYVGINTPIPLVFIFPMSVATLFLRPIAGLWTLLILMIAFAVRLATADVPADAALRFMLIGTENLAAFTAFLMLGTSILHRALRATFAANDALQQLVNATFEAIAIHDHGQIVDVNPAFCQMYGAQRSAIIGKSLVDFIAPEQREIVRRKIVEGDTEAYETLALRSNHTTFPIELVGKPINHQGRVVQITAIHNIAERKLAETQRLELALAKQKVDMLKEFLNTLSHDLKTPLSVINTSLYLLEKDTNAERRQPRLEQIKLQSAQLGKLIQDVLAANRIDSIPNLRFNRIDVNMMLTKIKTQFDLVAEKKQITIALNLDDNLPTLLANEEELERALINLVENALRYTLTGGTVTIHTFEQADSMVVEVQDTGIGIAAADLPHIFEHFYRANKAKATDVSGTGLGLAIVKKIVEMHHGSIEVESELEKGSAFRIRLPLVGNAE